MQKEQELAEQEESSLAAEQAQKEQEETARLAAIAELATATLGKARSIKISSRKNHQKRKKLS